MRVVVDGLIYRRQSHGGISRIFDNIIPGLCDLSEDVSVLLLVDGDPLGTLPQHERLSIMNLRKWDGYMRPWRVWGRYIPAIRNSLLKAVLGNTRQTIWFSTYYSLPPFRWDGPQVALVHDFVHELFPDLLPDSASQIDLKRRALLKADAVICVSSTTAEDLRRFFPLHTAKVHVVRNGFNQTFQVKADEDIQYRLGFPYILYVGKRRYYKGFDTLLKAYSHWTGKADVRLVVVGESWSEDERMRLQQSGLRDRVVLLEHVDDHYLCDLYNRAGAFVYPSLYEGFGIPLLEAMACRCPIVASKIPSTLEIAQDIPYYFEPSDVAGLTEAIDEALAAKALDTKIQKGLSLVAQHSWESMSRGLLEAFMNVQAFRN